MLKIKEPKYSTLLFTSGKIVCTGTRSLEKVKEAVNNVIKLLNKIGYNIKPDPIINIQNMVASGGLGVDLNLNKIATQLKNVEYEPEQFPGLVYKIKEARASFLLFSNGKIVCTGIKSKKELDYVMNKLIKNLKKINAI